VQVDPIKPTLKVPAERLKSKSDELLSNVAFKFKLRRYIKLGGGHVNMVGWCRLTL
jgi:hypothetical protein